MRTISYEQIINDNTSSAPSVWIQRLGPVPMAVVMTCAILFVMQSLVHMEVPDTVDEPLIPIPNFISDVPKTIATQEDNELPKKPELIERPENPEFVEPIIAEVDTEIINTLRVDTTIAVTQDPGAVFSGQPMPIVRINPNYPASAVSRNIEGYVDVVFDITPIGTTTNVRITGYSPSTVFNSSVLKAVRGWKYRAAADETGSQITLDVKERITFVLEK